MFATPLATAIFALKYPGGVLTPSREWALTTLRHILGKDFGDDVAAWEACAQQHPEWSFKSAAKKQKNPPE